MAQEPVTFYRNWIDGLRRQLSFRAMQVEQLRGEWADLLRQRDYVLQVIGDIRVHLATEVEPNLGWIGEQLAAANHYCLLLSSADRSQDSEQEHPNRSPLLHSAKENSSHYRIDVGQMDPEM